MKGGNVIVLTDHGTKESRQHGEFVTEERDAKQGKAIRSRKVKPLEALLKRGYISRTEFDAGERLAETWFRAGYERATTVNLFGTRGGPKDYTPTQLDARRDFDKAMRDLGSGLTGPAYEICCLESTVRSLEEAMAWRKGTGLTVLKIALHQLAVHYGYERPEKSG